MKSFTHIKCIVPFTDLSLHYQGECYSCCPNWSKVGSVGKLTAQNSIMDIWNSEKMQLIRQAIYDDQLDKVCNFKYCPIAMKNEWLDLETMRDDYWNRNQIIEQIMSGATIMETSPYTFVVANSGRCNLKCAMCISNEKFMKYDNDFEETLFTKIIPEILPGVARLHLEGNGEVFFNPYALKFLQTLDPSRYPSLRIQFLTNGTLFTPKLWESIGHNRYEFISVSIDAASKDTYERIRKNGKWERLRNNLNFISELRRQNIFTYFRINFCVMKSNYQEMRDFVKLGLELGCDKIVFLKIYGRADVSENINLTQNKKVFAEITAILADPLFQRPEVDTTLIDEYRKYSGHKVSVWDNLMTKGNEWLGYLRKKSIS